MQRPLPVLFAHFGDNWIRGSEQVLLDLLGNMDRTSVEPIIWCNADAMAEACRAMGLTTYQDRFDYYFDYGSPRFDPRRYAHLVHQGVRLIRRHAIAVVHVNSAAPAQWLVPAGRLTHRPVLVHLHINYLRRSRYALLLHAADLIVGVSRQAAEDLLEDGMEAERVRLIYNGIDPARLTSCGADLRATLAIPPEALVVASIGSLVRRKGHDVLLRAFARLPPLAVPSFLLIAGDGEARGDLETLCARLGLDNRVRFTGYSDDPGAIYRAADIFSLASRNDACPLVLLEAGHFGLPVIATDVGGIGELVADGETGLLVPPDDIDALARALHRLATQPELRAAMGSAARQRVARLFTVERMTADFLACYRTSQERRLRSHRALRLLPYARLLGFRPRKAPKPASTF